MSNGTKSETSISAELITIEAAAEIMASGVIREMDAGGLRLQWLQSETGEQVIVQGPNGEFVKLH